MYQQIKTNNEYSIRLNAFLRCFVNHGCANVNKSANANKGEEIPLFFYLKICKLNLLHLSLHQQIKQTMTTTSLFQIVVCLRGLEFEKKTGMKMSRISARDCAKRILGYKTNQRPTYDVLIAQMTELKTKAEQIAQTEDPAVLVW